MLFVSEIKNHSELKPQVKTMESQEETQCSAAEDEPLEDDIEITPYAEIDIQNMQLPHDQYQPISLRTLEPETEYTFVTHT